MITAEKAIAFALKQVVMTTKKVVVAANAMISAVKHIDFTTEPMCSGIEFWENHMAHTINSTLLAYSLSATDEKMGAEVFSLGFPKPWVFGDGLIFTDGKVSATKGLLGNEVNYQMTVPITFGNSGGPIFNKLGQVIGISVAGTLDVELLTASYSVKSKYLIDLLKTVTDYAPASKEPSTTSLEDQIEAYKNFVYLIEVSSE